LHKEIERHPEKTKTKSEIELRIDITPDIAAQKHRYFFSVTQEEVKILLSEFKQLLDDYPIMGIYPQ